MADIKIDEIEFFNLLNRIDTFMDETLQYIPDKLKDGVYSIKSSIKGYQDVNNLKLERKAYYNFYINNRILNPEEANIAYRKYLMVREELEKLK